MQEIEIQIDSPNEVVRVQLLPPRAQQYSTPCMTACWGVCPQVKVLNSEVDFDNEH